MKFTDYKYVKYFRTIFLEFFKIDYLIFAPKEKKKIEDQHWIVKLKGDRTSESKSIEIHCSNYWYDDYSHEFQDSEGEFLQSFNHDSIISVIRADKIVLRNRFNLDGSRVFISKDLVEQQQLEDLNKLP